jgi:hypothetical protein
MPASDRRPPRYRRRERGLAGAEAVLTLRAVITNGDFDEYWRFHLAREHQRLYPGTDQVRRFTFTIESRCVIAAAARTGRAAACGQLRGITDARN